MSRPRMRSFPTTSLRPTIGARACDILQVLILLCLAVISPLAGGCAVGQPAAAVRPSPSGEVGAEERSVGEERSIAEPVWREVEVVDAAVFRDGQGERLTVRAWSPTSGWRVRLKPLPSAEPATREFRVVGLDPGGERARVIEEHTLEALLQQAPAISRVVVHGKGGQLVLEAGPGREWQLISPGPRQREDAAR